MRLVKKYKSTMFELYGSDRAIYVKNHYQTFANIGSLLIAQILSVILFIQPEIQIDSPIIGFAIVFSIVGLIGALLLMLTGYDKMSTMMSLGVAGVVCMGSILIAGGIPQSESSPMAVVIPMLTFLLYGRKSGVIVSLLVFVVLVGQVILRTSFGIALPDYGGHLSETARIGIWFANFSILLLLASTFRQQTVQLETDLKKQKAHMEYLASTDSLTGLQNSYQFSRNALASIQDNIDEENAAYVIYIDLNKFKPINDRFGHHTGNHVLKTTAKRLSSLVEGKGFAGRLGGDEFAILIQGASSRVNIRKMITQLQHEIEKPIHYQNETHHVSASMGYSKSISKDDCIESLLEKADADMYLSKLMSKKSKRYAA